MSRSSGAGASRGSGPSLPEHAVSFLRDEIGVDGAVVDRPVAFEEVRLREPALGAAPSAPLEAITGAVRDDREARVLRCRGKSYLDLLAQRAGACEDAPDAVVAPADHEQVLAVLQVCARPAWRWCRSAAARAWWAASSRCAGRSRRWSRSTSGAWTASSPSTRTR